jgi:hypothetical protein
VYRSTQIKVMNEIYKKELSKFSLLSNKEELELAKQA